jgi:hypothetical protein
VERQLRLQRGVHRVLVIGEQQRMAVGRGARSQLARDNAVRAGAIFDDHLLLEYIGQAGAHHAREEVGAASAVAAAIVRAATIVRALGFLMRSLSRCAQAMPGASICPMHMILPTYNNGA